MTDQMDHRLEELVTKLAAAAPEAPPFPAPRQQPHPPRRVAPAWALAAAGAAVVLVIIGLPFLLFGGSRSEDPIVTSPAPTTVVTPTTSTTPTTTSGEPGLPACTPRGLLVRSLGQDGAAGHVVTPLRFINVSGGPCTLDDPVGVTGVGVGGEEVPAGPGTYVPIGEDSGPLLAAGEARTMLVEVGTGCEGGALIGPEADAVVVTLATGDVTVPFAGDLGCGFAYTGFGGWLEAEPATATERAVAGAVISFASDPSPEHFAAIPLADPVTLTLGPTFGRSQPADSLALAKNWVFDTSYDGFRAYVGPFSALDLLADPRPVDITAGPHDHCASPPMPVYEDLAGLRQVTIQPTDATSCLEWFAVDLFLDANGDVAGVTMDVWEP